MQIDDSMEREGFELGFGEMVWMLRSTVSRVEERICLEMEVFDSLNSVLEAFVNTQFMFDISNIHLNVISSKLEFYI